MIKYTEEQMNSLRQVLFDHTIYVGYVLEIFLGHSVDKEHIALTCSPDIIYKRMKDFHKSKNHGRHPDKEICETMEKIKNIIFEVKKDDLPLYINDPLTEPITLWRLRNNI